MIEFSVVTRSRKHYSNHITIVVSRFSSFLFHHLGANIRNIAWNNLYFPKHLKVFQFDRMSYWKRWETYCFVERNDNVLTHHYGTKIIVINLGTIIHNALYEYYFNIFILYTSLVVPLCFISEWPCLEISGIWQFLLQTNKTWSGSTSELV